MRISTKLGLTGLLAAMLLAAAISTASARSFEVSHEGFLVSWSRLEFRASNGVTTVRCQVTLDGSFHSRTIAKTAELVGAISQVIIKRESCTGGEALPVDATLPWHVTYQGFAGALPSITTLFLLLSRFQFRIESSGVTCFYGIGTDNVTGRAAINGNREVTNLAPVAGRNIASLLEGRNPGELFGCPTRGSLVSANEDGIVNVLNNWTTRITVRLI